MDYQYTSNTKAIEVRHIRRYLFDEFLKLSGEMFEESRNFDWNRTIGRLWIPSR